MKVIRSVALFRKLLILICSDFNVISCSSCRPACNEHTIRVSCPGVCACNKKYLEILLLRATLEILAVEILLSRATLKIAAAEILLARATLEIVAAEILLSKATLETVAGEILQSRATLEIKIFQFLTPDLPSQH